MADDDGYEVGKGKPPPWGRFRKGEPSRNPNGRPKKKVAEVEPAACGIGDIYRRELNRKLCVKDGDGTRELTAVEVVARAQVQTAIKGSPHAQRDVLKTAELIAQEDARQRKAEEEKQRQLFCDTVKFREIRAREWASAEERGEEPDDPWPHPDDIIIDHKAMRWRIRGPFDGSDLPLFEYYRAERDACFARAMIEIRKRRVSDCARLSIWDPLWMTWDSKLPLRWQVLPRQDSYELSFLDTSMRKLRRFAEDRAADARTLGRALGFYRKDKDGYKFANSIMKPLLQRQGYRSLAEFERAYEDTGGNPPWPKPG